MTIPSIASKSIKIFSVTLAVIALYGFLGFYLLPTVLTAQLPKIIQQQTGRQVSLTKLAFNPFSLRCRLQAFKMMEKNGQAFVSFDDFVTKINLWQSIRHMALTIEEVSLAKPFVHLVRQKNDSFNFSDLSKSKPEEKKPSNGLFPLSISKIEIIDGKLLWEDNHQDKAVKETITPINLKIEHFTTHADQSSNLGLTLAEASGGKLDWKGKISVNPIASEGHISLNNIKLQTLLLLASSGKPAFDLQGVALLNADYTLRYLKDNVKLSVQKSKLELHNAQLVKQDAQLTLKIPNAALSADYKLDQSKNNLKLNADKFKLALQDVQFEQRGASPLQIKLLDASHETNLAINLANKQLHVTTSQDKIELHELRIEQQGSDKKSIKIPLMRHETDITLDQGEKGLELKANKAKLAIYDVIVNSTGGQTMQLNVPTFSHETDFHFTLANKIWHIGANKTTVLGKDIQLSGLGSESTQLKIPEVKLETGYQADNSKDSINLVTHNGQFDVQQLQWTDGKAPLTKLKAFSLKGIGLNLNNKELKLDSATAQQLDVNAWLNPDNTLNYQALFAAPTSSTKQVDVVKPTATQHTSTKSSKKTAATDKAWQVKVNSLALKQCGVDFEDRTLKKTVKMMARPIDLQIKNFTTQSGASLPVQLSVGINKSGLIKMNGNAVIQPLSTQLAVTVNRFALDKFQPYVDKFARLDIIDGDWNLDGKVTVAKKADDVDIKFKGDTNITDLVTRDQLSDRDFVKWEQLSLKTVEVDVLDNRYTAGMLTIDRPYARVTIRQDKTMNVNDILIKSDKPSEKTQPVAVKTSSRPTKKPYFRLNSVKIIEGSSDFSDLSLILPFSAPIKGLNGGASGLSSEQNSKIKVTLEGNAFELSPVKIKGAVSPYLGDFDVDMNFEGMPMPLVSPYMVQFAGYKVEKGKLTLGLKYAVEKKQLTASNNILIDQLELGEKVENPNAVSLPLELAITLLKDSDGKIKIDMPLTGSLEDPKFSLGGLIADTLMNVLSKIVTAPFSAIAGMIGSDEDLSVVNFSAGRDTLTPEQTEKLDGIAKALKERPALSIEIKGAAFQEQDWPALRTEALHDQLKRLKANEIKKDSGKKIRIEHVELSDDDYKRLLEEVFMEQFPQLAKKSLFGAPTLVNAETTDFYSFAQKKLSEALQPDYKRLKDLAVDRAAAIAKYLVQKAGIPNERVFILDTAIDPERTDKEIACRLSLKAS